MYSYRMIGRMPRLVEPGQFVKFRGHKVRDDLYLQWWKVLDIEAGTLVLVNRQRRTRRLGIDHIERLRWKALVWEPGDDRADETADVFVH